MTTATIHGNPGERSRLAGLWRLTWPIAGALLFAGYFLRAALPWPPLSPVPAGWALVLLGLLLLSVMTLRYRRAGAYFIGARGEQAVARVLEQLPVDYTVFHGLRLPGAAAGPGADLDHVVLGPSGIVVIETKCWSGRVTLEAGQLRYNGRLPQRSPIRQAADGAEALAGALRERLGGRFHVQALVCFAGNRFLPGEGAEAGVQIRNADRLLATLSIPADDAPSLEARQGIARVLQQWLNA